MGVTSDISIVGILVGRSIHPVPDTEKNGQNGNDGADDEKTARRTVSWFAFLIGVNFLRGAPRRRSSCDVVG